ncbi:hypothetical protein T484DRAFT_1813247 [Baffinella frigidus]|nr:hypothetical protein T484DRAFT_1813247 [Cryptophyta sp. CCMP2293]
MPLTGFRPPVESAPTPHHLLCRAFLDFSAAVNSLKEHISSGSGGKELGLEQDSDPLGPLAVETLNLWCSRLEPPEPKGHPEEKEEDDAHYPPMILIDCRGSLEQIVNASADALSNLYLTNPPVGSKLLVAGETIPALVASGTIPALVRVLETTERPAVVAAAACCLQDLASFSDGNRRKDLASSSDGNRKVVAAGVLAPLAKRLSEANPDLVVAAGVLAPLAKRLSEANPDLVAAAKMAANPDIVAAAKIPALLTNLGALAENEAAVVSSGNLRALVLLARVGGGSEWQLTPEQEGAALAAAMGVRNLAAGARETREEVLRAKGVLAMGDLLRPWTRKKLTTGVSDEEESHYWRV